MPRGEKLFKFLVGLMLERFYGTVTIRFESGKATHVEIKTQRTWQYSELPQNGLTNVSLGLEKRAD